MAARETPPCCKSYGLPFYCAACVPIDRIDKEPTEDQDHDQAEDRDNREQDPPKPSPATSSDRLFVALGGGGGEGHSGVPNALIVSAFDFASRSLSDHPVSRLGTGNELPYRMAMHPGGDGLVCSFPKSCRLFEWELPEEQENIAVKSSERILTILENVGQQLALTFNTEGSIFASGGEVWVFEKSTEYTYPTSYHMDGHLRVFNWPSMEIILDQSEAHSTVKDLDFSPDSKYLVSSGSSGPCRVWDLTSSVAVASLQREDGEMFCFCRFSRSTGDSQMLYVAAMHGHYGKIISWNVNSWKRTWSKKIIRDTISAFNASSDGKFLAVGTIEGNVVIIDSTKLQLLTTIKKAHLGIVTAVVFSKDSRALVSTSFDYTTRVTLIEGKKTGGMNMTMVLLVLLISYMVYYFLVNQGIMG